MLHAYYYLVLFNAVLAFCVAGIIFWRNRYQPVGPAFGTAMVLMGFWLIGFAQYFRPLTPATASYWAHLTLGTGILSPIWLFFAIVVLVDRLQALRWWCVVAGISSLICLGLLAAGKIVTGIHPHPMMDHYVSYNRALYGVLVFQIFIWQWLAGGLLIYSAIKSQGYRRVQYAYYAVSYWVIFLAANLIIVPLEYDINLPPIGFLILPFDLALLAYVGGKARVADFNVFTARALLYTVMLLLVAAVTLLFIGIASLLAPGFMNQSQVVFAVGLVMTIGFGFAAILPRFLPYAEHIVQERFFAGRLTYQDILTNLIRELSNESNVETLLERVVTTIQNQMQVSRSIILLQDPVLDQYRVVAQSGIPVEEREQIPTLTASSALVRWLTEHGEVFVPQEQVRVLPPPVFTELNQELSRMGGAICVPMLLDKKLTGFLCLGEKVNREIFFGSDLKLLTTLTTDMALAIRYRRIEEQAVHNNKLITLGTIAAGIAHEVRNPLASIRTFAQLLPSKIDDPEFTNEFRKIVLQDVERITRVIQSMLSFARPGTVNIGNHTAAELVDEALMLAQSRLNSKHVQVTKQLHNHLTLCADKQQILQVLLNILNNAVDAMPDNGTIRITTGTHAAESQIVNTSANFAVIEIADSGPGIPAAVRARLFDPFFTTKPEGTGLGLSISQKIARDHNGYITVTSIEGMGASFQLHLPLD